MKYIAIISYCGTDGYDKNIGDIFDESEVPQNIINDLLEAGYIEEYVGQKPISTADATAIASDILKGKTAYAKGVKLYGTHSSSGSTVNITDTSYLFSNNVRIDKINEILSICKDVISANHMFSSSGVLTSVDLSNFDTSKITDMSAMFQFCGLTSIDLSNFNTSHVRTMASMFASCSSLKTIDLSSFDTSRLVSTTGMFSGCIKLTAVIINNPNVFKLTSTDAFSNTPIKKGTGYVYVPDDLVDTYKTAQNWSTYANQIKGISELPT